MYDPKPFVPIGGKLINVGSVLLPCGEPDLVTVNSKFCRIIAALLGIGATFNRTSKEPRSKAVVGRILEHRNTDWLDRMKRGSIEPTSKEGTGRRDAA